MSVYIIAEAGVNHNGDIKIAERLIDVAKESVADAVKFQSFIAEKLVTKYADKADYQIANTNNQESQYNMLLKLQLSSDNQKYLYDYCKEKQIVFLSTPFDFDSADVLETLDVSMYKISSGDLTNLPFLRYIAKKNKPTILSTGMSTLDEIEEALKAIYSEGNDNVTVLHCTTNYPVKFEEVNLKAMMTIRDTFNVKIGYSDHTEGIEVMQQWP